MRCCLILVCLFCLGLPSADSLAGDLAGPSQPVPRPKRVYGSAPPITFMLYVLDRDLVAAVNAPVQNGSNSGDAALLSPDFLKLPVVGGWHGDRYANLEELLRLRPDLVVCWNMSLLIGKMEDDLARVGLRMAKLDIDDTAHYPEAFRRLGDLVGSPARGAALAAHAERELKELQVFVASIPESQRVRVYYAEGRNGLQTDCDQSFHAEPIRFAGGRNVHRCVQRSVTGLQTIGFEQLLNYDPEVIVAQDPEFFRRVFSDRLWRQLAAVRNRRVYLVPKDPFNWLDRPPSFMRILGSHWLASCFYPRRYPYALREKVRAFYALFFGVELSEAQFERLFPWLRAGQGQATAGSTVDRVGPAGADGGAGRGRVPG